MRQVALVALATFLLATPLLPTAAAGNDCVSLCVTIPGQVATYYVYANSVGCPHGGPSNCFIDGLVWQETNSLSGLQTKLGVSWQPDALLVA